MADNTITIIGNLTRDPELRSTNTGKNNTTFSIAVTRKWEGGEQTSFFDCVAWNGLADNIASSFNKGDRIIVTGRLEQRSWDTKEGEKRYKVEVVVADAGASVRWNTVSLSQGKGTAASQDKAVAAQVEDWF